jgi:hypothetical protein
LKNARDNGVPGHAINDFSLFVTRDLSSLLRVHVCGIS